MSKKTNQFIYVLKLIDRLIDDNNWTEEDNDIVGRHFKVLQELQKEGKLILAGRTLNPGEDSFGIVVFNANTEEEAQKIMENDPAVKEGIMTAKVYPYRVALISEENA